MSVADGSDKRVPPDVPALLRLLKAHSVEFVLTGSMAVEAWGADVGVPGDLDIVPAKNQRNLTRLTEVLNATEGSAWPLTGQWDIESSGEALWVEYDANDPRRGSRLPPPNPDDLSTLDSLFSTVHGELDIVPLISGSYDEFAGRATALFEYGVDNTDVMSIGDLLVYLIVPRRKKKAGRVAVLRGRPRESRRS
jgi:hypothetical protein